MIIKHFIISKMSYDLRDDMLECFCGNSKYKHYYNPKEKK